MRNFKLILRTMFLITGVVIAVVNIVYLSGHSCDDDVIYSHVSNLGSGSGSITSSDIFPPLDDRILREFTISAFSESYSSKHEKFRGYDRYVVFDERIDTVGYVYEIQEDLKCPVCNNVRMLVALDDLGRLHDIRVLEPLELSGEPLSVEDETRFLRQFKSKPNLHFYVLGENIDGITGATKSSIHIVDALNRLRHIHRG